MKLGESNWLARSSWLRERVFSLSDWHFEVAGILGLSLSTNVLASMVAKPETVAAPTVVLVAALTVFGAGALRCGFYLRGEYETYWRMRREDRNGPSKSFRRHLAEKVEDSSHFSQILGLTVLSGCASLASIAWLFRAYAPLPPLDVSVEALAHASHYFLAGFGFMIIFVTARFFPLSQAAVITAGPYFVVYLLDRGLSSTEAAVTLALALCGGLGLLTNQLVFRPLYRRQATALVKLVASLGLYTFLQNLISLLFGDATIRLAPWFDLPVVEGLGIRVGSIHLWSIGFGALVLLGSIVLLRFGSLGRNLRAVAEDPELAEVKGIASHRVVAGSFFLGSVLAGGGGILVALDSDLTPTMGLPVLLMGIVAALFFGRLDPISVGAGAVALAALLTTGDSLVGADWRNTLAFSALIVLCMVRLKNKKGK